MINVLVGKKIVDVLLKDSFVVDKDTVHWFHDGDKLECAAIVTNVGSETDPAVQIVTGVGSGGGGTDKQYGPFLTGGGFAIVSSKGRVGTEGKSGARLSVLVLQVEQVEDA